MLPNEHKNCNCAVCQHGLEAVEAHEAKCMEKYGWYAHCVAEDPDSPTEFNYHTHGCMVSFNHPDLQIVIPLDAKTLTEIAYNVIKKAATGTKLEDGVELHGIVHDYPVRLRTARECDRDVLRICLPDIDGLFETSESGNFMLQYQDL